jgi:hypothetical protein
MLFLRELTIVVDILDNSSIVDNMKKFLVSHG